LSKGSKIRTPYFIFCYEVTFIVRYIVALLCRLCNQHPREALVNDEQNTKKTGKKKKKHETTQKQTKKGAPFFLFLLSYIFYSMVVFRACHKEKWLTSSMSLTNNKETWNKLMIDNYEIIGALIHWMAWILIIFTIIMTRTY
jgi:uncharacterized ion transporter superfamily protein YfcC